ncbi:hypothetical protein BHM03_00002947 [Ensete ventricosum]|uniref:NIF system FeS cluster assembly NifU N-terminal domain-containing protein n=1 Tax=Ensete ventricosum TaxID=4639 RepID=A0A445M9V3_ENSVE|nr:hypothetical protein BHM03_00002947 [Ensete ventricosum]
MLRAAGRRFLRLGSEHRAPTVAVAARGYHERVVDHYDNPRNVGSFDKNDPSVGTGLVGAPACGDVMKLQIKVDDATGKIVDACFKTFGCGSAIASSSVGLTLRSVVLNTFCDLHLFLFFLVTSDLKRNLATEWVKGKHMEEVLSIKNTEIAKHLSLPPVKLHCSMLAEDAIKAAVKDYEAKKAKLAAGNAETTQTGKVATA